MIERLNYFFTEIVSVKWFMGGMAVSFAFAALLCALAIWQLSDMAKVRRADKRICKFFRIYGEITKSNMALFGKRCIGALPRKVRLEWDKSLMKKEDLREGAFERTLIFNTQHGGALCYGIYIYAYMLCAILAVSVLALSGNLGSINAAYAAMSLIVGGVGLLLLSVQLYVTDRRAVRYMDSVIGALYDGANFFAAKPAQVEQAEQRSIAKPNIGNATCIMERRADDAGGLEELISREEKIAGGFCSCEGATSFARASTSDNLDILEKLIERLKKDGASIETLRMIRKTLEAVNATDYNDTADKMRMKAMIRRLEQVIG